MKSKGYTLTEVLATIAILGIVIGLAVPSITKLKNEIDKKKIIKDANMFIALAKEYIEANPNIENHNASVKLSDINKSKLNGDKYDEVNSAVTATDCSLGIVYKCKYSVILINEKYKARGNEDNVTVEVK